MCGHIAVKLLGFICPLLDSALHQTVPSKPVSFIHWPGVISKLFIVILPSPLMSIPWSQFTDSYCQPVISLHQKIVGPFPFLPIDAFCCVSDLQTFPYFLSYFDTYIICFPCRSHGRVLDSKKPSQGSYGAVWQNHSKRPQHFIHILSSRQST